MQNETKISKLKFCQFTGAYFTSFFVRLSVLILVNFPYICSSYTPEPVSQLQLNLKKYFRGKIGFSVGSNKVLIIFKFERISKEWNTGWCFNIFSPEPISTELWKNILGERAFSLVQIKGEFIFKGVIVRKEWN